MGDPKEPSPFIVQARKAQDSVSDAVDQIKQVLRLVPILEMRIDRMRSGSGRAKAEAELEELEALLVCAEACVALRHDLIPLRKELRGLKKAVIDLKGRLAAKGVPAVA